jgi:hypothetical protein
VSHKVIFCQSAGHFMPLADHTITALTAHFSNPPCQAQKLYSELMLTNAIALEKMSTPYINVAVKCDNANSQWAQDIVAAYKSPSFKAAILSDRYCEVTGQRCAVGLRRGFHKLAERCGGRWAIWRRQSATIQRTKSRKIVEQRAKSRPVVPGVRYSAIPAAVEACFRIGE